MPKACWLKIDMQIMVPFRLLFLWIQHNQLLPKMLPMLHSEATGNGRRMEQMVWYQILRQQKIHLQH